MNQAQANPALDKQTPPTGSARPAESAALANAVRADSAPSSVLSINMEAIEIEETARRCELLGASFADLGRWPEAEAAFRRAVKLEPNDSGMLMNLGEIVGNLGRYAEAAELFEQLLRVDPNNVTANTNLPWLRKQMANG